MSEARTQVIIPERSREVCVTYFIGGVDMFSVVITGVTGAATIGNPNTTTVTKDGWSICLSVFLATFQPLRCVEGCLQLLSDSNQVAYNAIRQIAKL